MGEQWETSYTPEDGLTSAPFQVLQHKIIEIKQLSYRKHGCREWPCEALLQDMYKRDYL